MNRNFDIDLLKGISILAVVFYHFGVLPQGYLGVDFFLVINGYFITRGLQRSMRDNNLSYWQFIKARVVRLWPLVLLVGIVALIIGYFTMLPDDYENLAQGVVASNLFANNILGCLTAGDYWNLANAYKPLMHLWYVGIIVQMYVVYPILLKLSLAISKNKGFEYGVLTITLLSLLLYLMPILTIAEKFYLLPFRMFEIGIGGYIAVKQFEVPCNKKWSHVGLFFVAIFILLSNFQTVDNQFKVLATCIVGALIVCGSINNNSQENTFDPITKSIAYFGTASYSFFIWHQMLFSFYIYIFSADTTLLDLIILSVATMVVGYVSYEYIEKKIGVVAKRSLNKLFWGSLVVSVIMTGVALKIFFDAGVMRDVPELGILKSEKKMRMHAAYTDRIYKYEKPFENDGRLRVWCIGNSFARDMSNILLESEYADSIDLSYHYILDSKHFTSLDELDEKMCETADVVFIQAGCIPDKYRDSILERIKTEKIRVFGVKSYGNCMGNIYNRSLGDNYKDVRVPMNKEVKEQYYKERALWGAYYLDMMEPVFDEELNVRVFTDNKMYISKDCNHLTQGGATFYSKILPLKELLYN